MSAVAASAVEAGERVRLPLLARLHERIAARGRVCWADLGRAQAGRLARLSRDRARIFVFDLPALRAGGGTWTRLDRAGLPAPDEAVQAFLGWDLLNYMTAGELGELAASMAAHADSGCRLHALIQYSSKTMPQWPGAHSLDENFALQPADPGEAMPAPRYSPKALEKALPQWRVESTMLLNNGMQEFLFALRAAD